MNTIKPFKPAPYKKAMGIGEVIEEYKLQINGVIHVGGHYGQEFKEYESCCIEQIIFIDPLPKAYKKLKEKFGNNPNVRIILGAASDVNGNSFLNVSNNGQSSSILKPKEHLELFPNVLFEGQVPIRLFTLDSLALDVSVFNMMNVDVQGYEMNVLRGAAETLKGIDLLLLEYNEKELYEECVLLEELQSHLAEFKLIRKNPFKDKFCGDSVFINKKHIK